MTTWVATVARGVHPDPSGAALAPWETDVPMHCGESTVRPGDWILADVDCTLVIPGHALDAVVARAPGRAVEEDFSLRLIQAGYPLEDAYPLSGALREHLPEFQRTGRVPRLAGAPG